MEFSPPLAAWLKETGLEPTPFGSGEAEVLAFLESHIARLLETDPDSLKQIFYRLDVSESKVAQAFAGNLSAEWPAQLARLVLEREKQRLFWREHYRNLPS